ncbi:hypothetical protein CYY_002981 [Polysphondylium violaceum]|uniref:Uncharacterized protein n=1 Tax=Polysphondylium violaceum TaxID=133409 RepID=A0A8J4PVI1_9MYCE|nr:hypothetical protein CYY_002981 [Polysphondylium violaceum]
MEINNNIIDDNTRLQQENWEFKKAGCSNKDHISLILQIEKKDKKLEKRNRIIDQLKNEKKNLIDSILKLNNGKTNEIDQFKQEIFKLFNDKNNQTMNDLQSLYFSFLEEHIKFKSKLETSLNQDLKWLELNNKKEMESLETKLKSLETNQALLKSNNDEKEKDIQRLKEKLIVH